jgi:hypothetical protein
MAGHTREAVAGTGRFQQHSRTARITPVECKNLGYPTMQHAPFSTVADSRSGAALRRRLGPLACLAVAAALLSGCQTDGAPSNPLSELATFNDKKAEPAKPPEPPMTRSRAAMECWMKTEKGRGDGDLDKRADIVNKCIDEKLKTVQASPKS